MNKSNLSKETLERYYSLKQRLCEIGNKPAVSNTGDEMSFHDLRIALNDFVGKENKVFLDGIDKDIAVINRRNSLHKNSRRVTRIKFVSSSEEGYYCLVSLKDKNGNIEEEKVDNFIKLDVNSDEILRNKKVFLKYLSVLAEFNSKNRDIDYAWCKGHPYVAKQYITQGTLSYTIDVNNTNNDSVFFSDINDVNICHLRVNGGLSALETIEYYANSYASRLSVNLNDISPLLANVARKYYGYGNKKLVK